MKKFFATLVAATITASSGFALNLADLRPDGTYNQTAKSVLRGNIGLINTQFNETATFNDISITGTVSQTGVATFSAVLVYTPGAHSITNDGTTTINAPVMYLSVGDASVTATNTIIVPATDGQRALLVNSGASNAIHFADSTDLNLSATNITLGIQDTLDLHGVVTATITQWVQVSTSDN